MNYLEENPVRGLALLEDGANAFPSIMDAIRASRESILVHMFVWRDDEIGRKIAKELIGAADRGVSVIIEKDRYGASLEYAEETRTSFFHNASVGDWASIKVMQLAYHRDALFTPIQSKRSDLYPELCRHPRITVRDHERTRDHSKYYLFDHQVLILGSINIEDKELHPDMQGRRYRDYMIRIENPALIREFCAKLQDPMRSSEHFLINRKKPIRRFEMKDAYLRIIQEAQRELTVMMAYIVPDREILSALQDAMKRGVHVRIVIPFWSNFTDDLNKQTMCRLLKSAGRTGMLRVFLSDCMLHAKLIASEKAITLGSCNLNRRAFGQLDELNFLTENDGGDFSSEVRRSIEETIRHAEEIETERDLPYRWIYAAVERRIM